MDNPAKLNISGGATTCIPGHFFRREPGFPYYTLGCNLSGRIITHYTDGEIIEHRAISLGLTPPNTPYTASVPVLHRELWVFFTPRPEWRPWLNWGVDASKPDRQTVLPLTDRENQVKIIRGLRNVLDYSSSHLTNGPRLAELALEQVLVLAASLSASGGALDERLEKVLHAMRQDLAEPWREESLARIARLSSSRFSHLFSGKLGISPLKFLEKQRMERAKALLLSTTTPVKEIAAEVGYPDALHFSARFSQIVGRCPSQFRHLGS